MSLVAAIAALALGHGQIDPNVITWRTYKSGARSQAQDLKILEIDTLADYQRYLNNYRPEGAGDGSDVDWNKEELVAIHIGQRPNNGYNVAVKTIVKANPREAKVVWAELTPIPGIAVGQSTTSPWTLVRLNRPGLRLTFAGGKEEGRLPGGIKIYNSPGYVWGCSCCAACLRDHENQLPWSIYASGDDAPVSVACTSVMSSPQDFANYTRNYNMPGIGDGSDVDWYRERLVAIHLGRKMTPGYEILIDHVDIVDTRRIDVSYTQVEPTGMKYGIGTPRGPYLVIRMPRVGSMVTFTKKITPDTTLFKRSTCSCGCDSCRCGH